MKRLDEFKTRKGAEKEPEDVSADEMHSGGAAGAAGAAAAATGEGGATAGSGRGELKVRIGPHLLCGSFESRSLVVTGCCLSGNG